jgi:hypothetical protein
MIDGPTLCERCAGPVAAPRRRWRKVVLIVAAAAFALVGLTTMVGGIWIYTHHGGPPHIKIHVRTWRSRNVSRWT